MIVGSVPHFRTGEPRREAVTARVDFDLEGLSEEDIQVLGHLSEAVDNINPIAQDQTDSVTPLLEDFADRLLPHAESEQQAGIVDDYRTILHLQNGPYDTIIGKSHVLTIPQKEVRRLVEKSGDPKLRELFNQVLPFLFHSRECSSKANFYPEEMTDQDFEALGEDRFRVNSRVVRRGGGYGIVINEEGYRVNLVPVMESLRRAQQITSNPSFRTYLAAKIRELETGSKEDRKTADLAWVRNDNHIDLILSTGMELYSDLWKTVRGTAEGNVMVVDKRFRALLDSLASEVPTLERTAPWELRREEIDPSTLPKLKAVNVFNWSGGQIKLPTTTAQQLPNDDSVVEEHGSIAMVYRNVAKVVELVTGARWERDVLPRKIFERYEGVFFEANQLLDAMHELGHATGMLAPGFEGRNASDIIGDEYLPLEEARAELFSIYSLPHLVRRGIITEDMMEAAYNKFVVTLVADLKFDPKRAHDISRNVIFHYFKNGGAIETTEEEGRTKFFANPRKMYESARELLGEVGNIKSYGRVNQARGLREKLCYADPIKQYVAQLSKDYPVGRGLIFPTLVKEGDRFTSRLVYPERFSDQARYRQRLAS